MDNEQKVRLRYLAAKWLKSSLDQDEQREFDSWISEVNDAPILVPAEIAEDRESHKLALFNKIQAQIKLEEQTPTIRLWPKIALAAAAVAAVVFGLWFFNADRLDSSRHLELVSVPQDVAPGKNGATLTLANGKVIALSDQKVGVVVGAELKYNDGSAVRYSSGSRSSGPASPGQRSTGPVGEERQLLVASTAKGQTYQVTLPDGTRVWLNADSKISFPSQFSGKERKILLSGEAYFEVVHNAKQPFRVESKASDGRTQVVEDIGTEFNINAYADETSVRTTLIAGSASVNAVVLKPNQQAILGADRKIVVSEANTMEAIAWKAGYFRFNDASIETVMKQLARWYNIEVVYEGKPNSEGFTGRLSRNKNISEALTTLEKTKGVHFKIEGRRVTIIN